MAENLRTIVAAADDILQPSNYSDYCPNGLQVEGGSEVKKIVSGVTASLAMIEHAISKRADILLVHHGYFWKGEDPCIRGMKYKRLKMLLENGVSLLAYHLPLDGHPELGNNAQLAKLLGFTTTGPLEKGRRASVGNVGELATPMSLSDFAEHVGQKLEREPQCIAGSDRPIKTVAWCTGAAQSMIDLAVGHEVDAYLTGEISEPTVHTAREMGIHFIAAGHHATERYGVQALGEQLAKQFSIEHEFVDVDNPV